MGIGICRDPSTCASQTNWIHSAGLKGYFCYDEGNLHDMSTGGSAKDETKHGKWPNFGNGDVIKVVLNCNLWECEFHKNGKMGAKISIPSNVKYFPIVGSNNCGGFHVEIV